MTEKELRYNELRKEFSKKIHEIEETPASKSELVLDGGQSEFDDITKWFINEVEKLNKELPEE